MTTDERNFRSSYYGKVGCRGVEEKKSLEILLKERPWDCVKLRQFCLRFTLPTYYRNLLWKVLLGIIPVQTECQIYVAEQRKAQVADLEHALKVMALVDEKTPKARQILAMWYLDSGRWLYNFNVMDSDSPIVPMAEAILKIFDDDVDVYWVTKRLYALSESFERDTPKLIDFTRHLLEKEDSVLYNHLIEKKAFGLLPLVQWFKCCFAGVLDDSSLVKIWDKLCGGSPRILSVAAAVLLIKLRSNILKAKDAHQILKCVAKIPDQTEEVANTTIELWQIH